MAHAGLGHRRRALDHRDRLLGILYYAFAAFLVPMQRDLGYSAAQLTGAFSLALAVLRWPASPSAATWTATARAR